MEIEIFLDLEQAALEDHELIVKRLYEWHSEGAEIRYDKKCFGPLTTMGETSHYRVDLGQVDPIAAIRELHARLYRFGAKVFIHFIP